MFSTRGRMAVTAVGSAELGGGRGRGQDGGRPGHVVLHAVHAGAALEVDPAGVEGDPLADQGDMPRLAPGGR